MTWGLRFRWAGCFAAIACALVMTSGATALKDKTSQDQNKTSQDKDKDDKDKDKDKDKDRDNDQGLVIEPAELPATYPLGTFQVNLRARGNFVPPLRWRVESGALPPGIKLEENGLLHGEAEKAGDFQFVVAVRDSNNPQQAVQKKFVIKVEEGIKLAWKVPAHVTANRIDGSVEVSNTTADDMDLTFDVKAVAEDGRATEIGYQHFPLKKGTVGMALPFGETLPHGAYIVYVNLVGEVARRNAIYRQRMQTPALQVVVGP
jgi:hypothetical protein